MQSYSVHDDHERLRRMGPPENEASAAVAVTAVLGRTPTVAVTLAGVQVFSTGVSFSIGLRCRPEALGLLDHRNVGSLLFDQGRGGASLFLGVELADGRRATNLPGRHWSADPPGPESLVFHTGGGGGSQLAAHQEVWLSPVPPDGPLRLVVRCDALDLPETVTELDGTAIRAAAADVVTLWPWVSPSAAEPPQPGAPDVPADSWFAGPA